jgi:pSer/pThr/pTyr-binding forkhead associated (FHA) protein
MKLSLVVTQGKGQGKPISIPLPQFLIGRDPECQLRPASPMISKRHCALLNRDGKAFVRDFASTNGTFVNDQKVNGEVELHDGDRLKIGPIIFLIRLEPETAAIKKPSPAPKAAGAPKPPPAGRNVDDESIADMLLNLQDEGEAAGPGPGGQELSTGSTVMEMPALAPAEQQTAGKPGEKGKQPAKKEMPNTSNAAKAILDKYARRTRG